MSGPLALLGEVINNGTAQWAQLRREDRLRAEQQAREDRLRQEQINREDMLYRRARTDREADIKDARTYEERQRDAVWKREDELYKARRWDAVKTMLVKEGGLNPNEAENPEAINAALARIGPERQRLIDELAGYKAAIPALIKGSKGGLGDVSVVLGATPENIAEVREFMRGAYSVVEKVVSDDEKRGVKNAENGAALMMAQQSKLVGIEGQRAEIEAEVASLNEGNFPQAVIQEANRRAAREAGKGATPDQVAAIRSKLLEDYRLTRTFQIQQSARTLNDAYRAVNGQYEAIKAAITTGSAAYMDPAAITEGAPAAAKPRPAASAPAVAGAGDMAGFLASTSTPPPAPPTPAQVVASPGAALAAPIEPPAALSPQQASTRRNEAVADAMRAFGYGVGNTAREIVGRMQPSNYRQTTFAEAPSGPIYAYEPKSATDDTARQIQQLESRLAALSDQTSATAINLRNQIAALKQRSAAVTPVELAPQ